MSYTIQQNTFTDEIKKKIFQGFGTHAISAIGINGLNQDPISFEIFDGIEFVGAAVVQIVWEQLHIKYLFINEKYRRQGIGKQLVEHAVKFGEQCGCDFAFVETMTFQAPEFYQKLGFTIEFLREGYAKNTGVYFLKKDLRKASIPKKITRTGVYGVAIENGKILLIKQKQGPHGGKFDFPGGGIEFGESIEQALRREFEEEVAMTFKSSTFVDNLTATIEKPYYTFYQIGMIYRIEGLSALNNGKPGELETFWIDPINLLEEQSSSLLWLFLHRN